MSEYTLPDYTGFLRYHTKWNRKNLGPYEEELFELFGENGIRCQKLVKLQGPAMTRFIVTPDSRADQKKLCGLKPYYKVIFERKDVTVYPHKGRTYIDVPWQSDAVWLGDLLVSESYTTSRGLPAAVGMSLSRKGIFVDLTDIATPHLLVSGSRSEGIGTFLHGLVLSLLLNHRPGDVSFWLCGDASVSFSQYSSLSNVRVCEDEPGTRKMIKDALSLIHRRLDLLARAGCESIYDYDRSMDHIILVINDGDALLSHRRREISRILTDLLSFGPETGVHVIFHAEHPACAADLLDFFQAIACFRTASKEDSVFLLGSDLAWHLGGRGELYLLDGYHEEPRFLQGAGITFLEIKRAVQELSVHSDQISGTVPQSMGFWQKLFARV